MKSLILIAKILSMVGVGASVVLMSYVGVWFLIPWTISWLAYDMANNAQHRKSEEVVK